MGLDLGNAGAIPALAATLQFAARRQELLAHNIANISTPEFVPVDVSVQGFQRSLGEAIERRRRSGNPESGLELESGGEVRIGPDGALSLRAATPVPGVLAHDRNARNLEKQLQNVVENATVYRVTADLLRLRLEGLRAAISERA